MNSLSSSFKHLKNILKQQTLEQAKNGVFGDENIEQALETEEFKRAWSEFQLELNSDSNSKELDDKDMALVRFLGREHEVISHDFKALFLSEVYEKFSEVHVAEIIKSKAGFDYLHKNKHIKEDEFERFQDSFNVKSQDQATFLMALNQVMYHQKKALKAEQIGQLLAYASSGLFEDIRSDLAHLSLADQAQHLIEHQMKNAQKLKVIVKDHGFKIDIESAENGLKESSLIAQDDVAVKCIADHCFINETTKTIVFGFSTSSDTVSDHQSKAAVHFKLALNQLVSEDYIDVNGKKVKNKYHGYHLKPFHLYTAHYHANDETVNNKGSEFVRSIHQALGHNKESQALLNDINQLMIFKNMTQWKVDLINKRQQFNLLLSYNPFMIGQDTLDFVHQQLLWNALSADEKEKSAESLMFKKATSIMQKMNMTDSKVRMKGILKNMEEGLKTIFEYAMMQQDRLMNNEDFKAFVQECEKDQNFFSHQFQQDKCIFLSVIQNEKAKTFPLEREVHDHFEIEPLRPLSLAEMELSHQEHTKKRKEKVDRQLISINKTLIQEAFKVIEGDLPEKKSVIKFKEAFKEVILKQLECTQPLKNKNFQVKKSQCKSLILSEIEKIEDQEIKSTQDLNRKNNLSHFIALMEARKPQQWIEASIGAIENKAPSKSKRKSKKQV